MKGKEIEIKLPVANPARIKKRLKQLGFHVVAPRVLERNTLFDTPAGKLRRQGCLLRLRQMGSRWWLTYKGPGNPGERYKVREERETALADGRAFERVLGALGFWPSFYYEKYRTGFSDGRGQALLDDTPVGRYLELEGPRAWIDRTARGLGFRRRDYVLKTYAGLFNEACRRCRIKSNRMSFAEVRKRFPSPNFS